MNHVGASIFNAARMLVIGERSLKIEAPPFAYVLCYPLAFVMLFPIPWFIAVMIFGEYAVNEGSIIYYCYAIGVVLSVPATILFVKWQVIYLLDDRILFRFTRYLIPKWRQLIFDQASKIVFHDGIVGRDGKPRPYLEACRKDGSCFWVPLPIFGRRDLGIMLNHLKAARVPVEITGEVRFVTGRRRR